MAKTYCKWPVIATIIVVSIIVFSIVFCIARCICCGAELACCCFRCCTCCCPSGGRNNKHKRMKSDPGYPPAGYPQSSYPRAPGPLDDQYRSHAPPTFHPAPPSAPKIPIFNPQPSPQNQPKPPREEPEYAHFDVSKPAKPDALPAMPSWNESRNIHVEEEVIPEKPNDVELDRLNHNGSVTGSSTAVAAIAGGSRASPGPSRSPVPRSQTQDSYGFPQGYQNDSFVGGGPRRSPHTSPPPQNNPYGQQQGGYGQPSGQYGDVSPVQQSVSPVYGAKTGYGQDPYYDRNSPAPSYNQQQQYRDPSPVQDYHQPNPYGNPYGNTYPAAAQDPVSMPTSNMYQNNDYSAGGGPRSHTPGSVNRAQMSASPARGNSPPGLPSALTAGYSSTAAKPETPAPAYPGQQSYGSAAAQAGAGQYRAFTPGAGQGQQHPGNSRTPTNQWV
ncbi:hypothetical protein DM02DRAFT_71701 [Periconia macrospinosa]|uniref:Uncharacterized protein n=1 Tax=Periconia macrospinosa TaxID=97972 RepID=A0A2V1E5R1_9PLEO|nr:hypothetical protein DM02DRAFT_71701 [Periconia macrospinosa]